MCMALVFDFPAVVNAPATDVPCSCAVLPFAKLNYLFFGYFDPENIFLDNKNK